jgi:hypothetical protein
MTSAFKSSASPLGATVVGDGVNFSVFSRQASCWVEMMHVDGFRSISPRPWHAMNWGSRFLTHPFCGTSSRTRCSLAPSSSLRRGMLPVCIKSAASSGTAGKNGTGSSAMTCEASSVAIQNARRILQMERARTSLNKWLGEARQSWHGIKLGKPDWSDVSHSLALYSELPNKGQAMYLIINVYWEPLDFELPVLRGGELWRRWVDISHNTPQDIVPWNTAPSLSCDEYRVESRSVVVLFAEAEPAMNPTIAHGL